jgi:hypothetical protein
VLTDVLDGLENKEQLVKQGNKDELKWVRDV